MGTLLQILVDTDANWSFVSQLIEMYGPLDEVGRWQ